MMVRVDRFLALCVCFADRCLSFGHFLLAIVLSVLLQFTDSDYLPLVSSNSSVAVVVSSYGSLDLQLPMQSVVSSNHTQAIQHCE